MKDDEKQHEPSEKALARAVLDKPEHKYTPDHTGKDPRDEATRDDALELQDADYVPEAGIQEE